jgi:hypothetical protein
MEERLDLLHLNAAVTVLIDGIEYSPLEFLNLFQRQGAIAVCVRDGEHDFHPGAVHRAAHASVSHPHLSVFVS